MVIMITMIMVLIMMIVMIIMMIEVIMRMIIMIRRWIFRSLFTYTWMDFISCFLIVN